MARAAAPERIDELDQMLYAGLPRDVIAKRLGITMGAVRSFAASYGMAMRPRVVRGAVAVGKLFGVTPKVVRGWIRKGHLQGQPTRHGNKHTVYLTTDEQLHRFIEDRNTWPVWQPERITDNAWRAWATEVRQRDPLLTAREVAERLHVIPWTVTQWCRTGQLPAVLLSDRRGYRIRQSALEDFVVPCERTHTAPHVVSDAERQHMLALRAAGLNYAEIGRRVGRDKSTVRRKCLLEATG